MTAAIATFAIRAAAEQSAPEFISPDELADLLRNARGATIVTVEARTEPRLLARHPVSGQPNPLKGNLIKVSRVNGIINWGYEGSVNRQRAREEMTPDFEALPRKWGFRLPGTPLVEHDGRLYLELKVERSLDHRYETFDGLELDSADVEAYLPQRSASRQGVSRQVILRDYALDNIISIRMGGMTYIVSSAVDIAASVRIAA